MPGTPDANRTHQILTPRFRAVGSRCKLENSPTVIPRPGIHRVRHGAGTITRDSVTLDATSHIDSLPQFQLLRVLLLRPQQNRMRCGLPVCFSTREFTCFCNSADRLEDFLARREMEWNLRWQPARPITEERSTPRTIWTDRRVVGFMIPVMCVFKSSNSLRSNERCWKPALRSPVAFRLVNIDQGVYIRFRHRKHFPKMRAGAFSSRDSHFQ